MTRGTPPCMLCWFSRWISRGVLLVTYCEQQRDIICDRQWINPEMCWRCCECASCPWRLLDDNVGYGE